MNPELLLLYFGEIFAKATVVVLLAALVYRVWRSASAAQRHFVWMAAILAILCLPATRLVAPRWGIPVQKPSVATSVSVITSEIEPTSAPIAAVRIPAKAERTPASGLPDWRSALLGVWLTGCVCLLGYRLMGVWNLRRLEKHGLLTADERIKAMTTNVLEAMAIKRPVRVRLSIDCRVPMTWGFQRPVLVLPSEAVQWDDARLAAALRHEAGHIARHDYPVRWIAHVTCAIYWMNPLVWLVAKSLRIAQEQATDDLVLRAGTPPEDYAAQLFDSARLVASHGIFARHAVAMATPSTLESRVLAIVDEQRDRRPLGRLSVATGTLAVASLLALCTVAQLQAAPPDTIKTLESADSKSEPSSTKARLSAKMRAEQIIIPKVRLREATLAECVEFLRKESKDRSSDGEGVQVIVKAPAVNSDTRITLDLTNVPVLEAANYVAQLANLSLNTEPEALVIGPSIKDHASKPAPAPAANPPGGAMKKAEEIVFPKIELREATIGETVEFLRAKLREISPDGNGIDITLPPGFSSDARITVSFTNIPLSEALRYVSSLANLEVRDLPGMLILAPKTAETISPVPVQMHLRARVLPPQPKHRHRCNSRPIMSRTRVTEQ